MVFFIFFSQQVDFLKKVLSQGPTNASAFRRHLWGDLPAVKS
jgi:hypothetical protein